MLYIYVIYTYIYIYRYIYICIEREWERLIWHLRFFGKPTRSSPTRPTLKRDECTYGYKLLRLRYGAKKNRHALGIKSTIIACDASGRDWPHTTLWDGQSATPKLSLKRVVHNKLLKICCKLVRLCGPQQYIKYRKHIDV